MRAPEPRSSSVIPVPHCPNMTVQESGYWPFKVGGVHPPSGVRPPFLRRVPVLLMRHTFRQKWSGLEATVPWACRGHKDDPGADHLGET